MGIDRPEPVRRAGRGLAIAMIAVSCGGSPAPPERPSASEGVEHGRSLPPSASCPSPPNDTTDDAFAGIRFEAPATAELQCDDSRRHCLAHVQVTIINCRPAAISVAHARSFDYNSPAVTVGDLPSDVPPGASRTFEATTNGAGLANVLVSITSARYQTYMHVPERSGPDRLDRTRPDALVMDLGPAPIRVTNPTHEAAERACQACNGDWNHHGMMRTIDPSFGVDDGFDCICRSTDRGKTCRDGEDCEGWCEFERFVVVKHAGQVDLGYAVGSCSEFTSQQSCATRIPDGARKKPPGPLDVEQSCID
jgi:hypothetical protein